MDETLLDFIKKIYADIQESNNQIKNRLDALDNAITEIKIKTSEKYKSIKNELESIQDKILETKYDV